MIFFKGSEKRKCFFQKVLAIERELAFLVFRLYLHAPTEVKEGNLCNEMRSTFYVLYQLLYVCTVSRT
jgi:hypothetical protein